MMSAPHRATRTPRRGQRRHAKNVASGPYMLPIRIEVLLVALLIITQIRVRRSPTAPRRQLLIEMLNDSRPRSQC